MLEVIEHEEHFTVAKRGDQQFAGSAPAAALQTDRLGHSFVDQRGLGDRSQWYEADAVFPARESLAISIAMRVLPTPPGPVKVSSRTLSRCKMLAIACFSRSRPIRRVSGVGIENEAAFA